MQVMGPNAVPIDLSYGSFNSTIVNASDATMGGLPSNVSAPNMDGSIAVPATGNATPSQIFSVFFAVVFLLWLLKYASEHEKTQMQVAFVRIGVWNMLVVTIMAMLGLATIKTLSIKYPIRGLSTVIAAS